MATVDNAPAGRVPSGATVDTDLDTRECSGQISRGCELSMVTWSSIEAGISVYVTALTQSLREQGFNPPAWDAAQIASQARDKAEAELKNPSASGKSSAYALAVTAANRKMADGLDLADVTQDVKDYLRYQWRGLQDADVDDIAQGAITETLGKWNPLSEPNWNAPGKGFAIGVAKHLAQHQMNAAPAPPPPPPRPVPPPKHILLDQWFNSEGLTWRERGAFIARLICGLPTFVAGAIISGGATPAACRAAWDRKRRQWLPSLRYFLGIP